MNEHASTKTMIEVLEYSYMYSNVDEGNTLVPQTLILDLIAYLKAQEPNLPAVDAVPVTWLKAHSRKYYEDWGEEPVTVENALEMWQKEQEAR